MRIRTTVLPLLILAACVAPSSDVGHQDKSTDYVSAAAVEIEARLTGKVWVELPPLSRSADLLGALRQRGEVPSDLYRLTKQAMDLQFLYARNGLAAQELHLKLDYNAVDFTEAKLVDGNRVEVSYSLQIDALLKRGPAVARAESGGLNDTFLLPLVPQGLYERAASTCATDFDEPERHVPADLSGMNFFYYFDARREGCVLGADEVTEVRFEFVRQVSQPVVYPEYDLLVADGLITVAVVFGEIGTNSPDEVDGSFIALDNVSDYLEGELGFDITQTHPERQGHVLEREKDGLRIRIELLSPDAFLPGAMGRDTATPGTYGEVLAGSEIFLYNGHASYGHLGIFSDPSIFPKDTYQIVFVNSCWSYAYYAADILLPHEDDAYLHVDMVNNTDPGYPGSEYESAVLLKGLFEGAARVFEGRDSTHTWQQLTKLMDDNAAFRYRFRAQYTEPDDNWQPESYGVSGVVRNRFRP